MRVVNLMVYAAFAALGEALVAKPALAWLRGRGLFRAALPWHVPLGGGAALLALALAAFTLALSLRFALGRRARVPLHAAFLALFALCLVLRVAAAEPAPPTDPTAPLFDGLRAVAVELDRGYAGRYQADPAALDALLSRLPPPGFVRLFRALPLHLRALSNADGPQLTPLAGDEPGTLYLALAADGRRLWLSALTLQGGEAAVLRQTVQATAGTHSLPGRDARVPAYPDLTRAKDR